MATKLYELSHAYEVIRLMAEQETDPEVWAAALNGIEDEATTKLLAIGRIIREQAATQRAIAFEVERLEARAQAAANAEKRLKQYCLENMTLMGVTKVEDATMSVSVQKSGPAAVIMEPNSVPGRYMLGAWKGPWVDLPEHLRVNASLEYDRRQMLTDHKAGIEIDGVEFPQSSFVRIR